MFYLSKTYRNNLFLLFHYNIIDFLYNEHWNRTMYRVYNGRLSCSLNRHASQTHLKTTRKRCTHESRTYLHRYYGHRLKVSLILSLYLYSLLFKHFITIIINYIPINLLFYIHFLHSNMSLTLSILHHLEDANHSDTLIMLLVHKYTVFTRYYFEFLSLHSMHFPWQYLAFALTFNMILDFQHNYNNKDYLQAIHLLHFIKQNYIKPIYKLLIIE